VLRDSNSREPFGTRVRVLLVLLVAPPRGTSGTQRFQVQCCGVLRRTLLVLEAR
jgi:hypothetical protein